MKIYLPHLHYTVFVRRFKRVPEGLTIAEAYVKKLDNHSCAIYLPKKNEPGDLAHELIHVLQFICESRNMDFCLEREHMAYLMHYLFGRIWLKRNPWK